MVIEALKAARDFIENDRQVLAESLTVNGEIVFEDDTDRRAMAEYVSVLVVIDGALEQALAAPVQAVPELAANVPGLADDPSAFIRWALKNNYDTSSHPMFFVMLDPKTNAARMGWKAAVAHYELATPPAAQPAVPEGMKLVKMQPHELAEQLYWGHPTYRGTKPLQWRDAPNEVRREWLDKAKAMLTTLPAAQPAPVQPVAFLANGARFKISYDSRQSGGQIHGIPPGLGGRWVAFVAADDDSHLKLTTPPAQPAPTVQEPVAWQDELALIESVLKGYPNSIAKADALRAVRVLQATPPAAQPAPVPLTDEQISEIAAQGHKRWLEFARAIEAAHGITKGQS